MEKTVSEGDNEALGNSKGRPPMTDKAKKKGNKQTNEKEMA
ncbi:hypothetical protein GCM10008934_34900 [Virgibacillus salarius]|nr:hypothetical protein [uncultured Virgibacillus sp.]